MRRSFCIVLAIAAISVVLAVIGYSQESENTLPSEYPAAWGVLFKPAATTDSLGFTISPLNPGTTLLPAGSTYISGGMALPCDIIRERDVPITLRDGTVIYTDVYLPVGGRQVPAIIAWSPYGKSVPQNADLLSPSVPLSWVSGLQKFEGPDPAFWCNHGYAVINVDVRGAFNSGGNIQYYGMVDAGDGYDVIEWAASQPWSNGKIGMAGNSWLAITQWFIAATQPPHLAAIAPWNGFSDYYRNSILQGGIPDLAFNAWLTNQLLGHNEVEDTISFHGSAVPAHGSLLEG